MKLSSQKKRARKMYNYLIPKLMEKAMIKRIAMLNDFTISPLMHMPQNGQKHFNNLAAFILCTEEYF